MIGISLKSISMTFGPRVSVGRLGSALSAASFMFSTALSMSSLGSNSTVIVDDENPEKDFMLVTPEMFAISFSSGFVRSSSVSDGGAPGRTVETIAIGNLISGNDSFGRLVKENNPVMMIPAIITHAIILLLMKKFQGDFLLMFLDIV